MVEKIAPDIEKLERNKGNGDVGMLEELTNNKVNLNVFRWITRTQIYQDKIGQLCSLQKINLERAESLGKKAFHNVF